MKMNFSEMKKIAEFYENLGDEESKMIYMARWKFCNDHNRVNFIKTVLELYSDWHLVDFSSYYERRCTPNSKKKLVIYGFGNVGKINKLLIKHIE